MTEIRLIKKYKNRRLYDTALSQYITVEELQRYVIKGLLFRVEDSVTGQDMTNATLLQILVDMESATQFLSTEMLQQLIVLAQHPLNQAMKSMMAQMMTFLSTQLPKQTTYTDYQHANEAWQQQSQQWLKQWQDFFKQ